jgi:two-component system repressor protein LuxO
MAQSGGSAQGVAWRLLVVEADPALARGLAAALAQPPLGAEVVVVAGLAAAEARLAAAPFDAVIAALDPDADGLAAVDRLVPLIHGPLIAISADGSISLAVEAIRRGAADFVVKPLSPEGLARRLAERLGAAAPHPPATGAAFEGFLGTSPAMVAVYGQIERIARSRAPAFVTGESGTGKEVAAHAIHARSARAAAPFLALNCGAIPRELMESEIFGHVRGAFTGATVDRAGAAELADRGTLFLDEICEMDLGLQAKLLRLVQTGELRRVGDTRTRTVDLRLVCATNRDPRREVAAGRFREDLFYRLHVLPLHLPPLRDRGADVMGLGEAFLARFAAEEGRTFTGFDPAAARLIAGHDWPGNVRQLQNAIRRIVVLNEGPLVTPDMLPEDIASTAGPVSAVTAGSAPLAPMWLQEQRIIEQALAACGGNIARAAAALEINPSTIYRKRQAWAQRIAAE